MFPIAVLAGGYATRLGCLSSDLPKCMIEINGKPFIDWQLKLLIDAGYKEFVFCVSHKSDQITNYLGNGSRYSVHFRYSLDGDKQLGTGGAIKKALPMLGENFAVIYGDSYLPINFAEVERAFLKSSALSLMTVFENNNKLGDSNVVFLNDEIIDYDKDTKNLQMRHIDYGLNYFKKEAFNDFLGAETFDLASLSAYLLKTQNLIGFEIFTRFYEVGSVQGIRELSNYLKENLSELYQELPE